MLQSFKLTDAQRYQHNCKQYDNNNHDMLFHPLFSILLISLGPVVSIIFQFKIVHCFMIFFLTKKRTTDSDICQIVVTVHVHYLTPGITGFFILTIIELINGVVHQRTELCRGKQGNRTVKAV